MFFYKTKPAVPETVASVLGVVFFFASDHVIDFRVVCHTLLYQTENLMSVWFSIYHLAYVLQLGNVCGSQDRRSFSDTSVLLSFKRRKVSNLWQEK